MEQLTFDGGGEAQGLRMPTMAHPKYFVEVGQRFGRGVVVDTFVRIPPKGKALTQRGARLRCDCGTEYVTPIFRLCRGGKLSCGCVGPNFIDRTGRRSGKLVAVRQAAKTKSGSILWVCRCDCGNEAVVTSSRLGSGKIKSCGCLKKGPKKGYLPGECARNRVHLSYRQHAAQRGLAWDLAEEDFCRLISLDCFYCGAPPSAISKAGIYSGEFTYNGVDRVDNAKGYGLDNVVTCCKVCNHAKKDMSFDAFMAWIARLLEYHWFRPEQLPSRLLKDAVQDAAGRRVNEDPLVEQRRVEL